MEKSKRVECFEISEEISDSIEIAYERLYGKKMESNQRATIYSKIINTFNEEEKYIDKALKAIKELNEYIKKDLKENPIDENVFKKWQQKASEIEELVYTERRESYKLAKDYIPKKAEDYYDHYTREELLNIEVNGGKDLHEKLSLLFGQKCGVIIGMFNTGMYDMNQKEVQNYLKENNVYYKKNRFTDIMSDELLCYKLAGIYQLKDEVLELYYEEYIYLEPEEKDKYLKTGYYDEKSEEYREIIVAAEMIGTAVKDTYYNKYYTTPLEELKNSNIYGTQLEIGNINKR